MEFSPLPPLQTPHTHKSISTPAVLKCRRSSGRLSWSRCQRGLWNPCCACYFSWLPDDILIEDIFGFLSIADRIRASGVCSRWWFLTQDPNLWQNVDLSSSAGNVDDQLLLATKRFLRQTKHLRLCKSKITDISAAHIKPQNLVSLELCETKVSPQVMISLISESGHTLKTLHLNGCDQLQTEHLIAISASCPNLTHLSISGCVQIRDEAIEHLASRHPQLQYLSLTSCRHLGERSMLAIAQHCRELRFLSMGRCKKITDLGLIALARHCSLLHTLDISSNNPFRGHSDISDQSIIFLARNCQKLKHLNLSGCCRISDDAVFAIAESLEGLQYIDFGGARNVSEFAFSQFLSLHPFLLKLGLRSCDAVTDSFLQQIPSTLIKLEYLDIDSCKSLTLDGIVTFLDQIAESSSLTHLRLCPRFIHNAESSNRLYEAASHVKLV